LAPNESIMKVTLIDKGSTFNCTGSEALFNNPGLKASEFMLNYDGKSCRIIQFKTSDYPIMFPTGYAIYGMLPYDQCGNG
ncbi:MAG TPA: hypothetical protein VLG50_01685, partial [Candidatus Saccharimonadales bacterium]|nr:hypothetical protein [Candidatus Saccharimonadales bacterium]